MIAKRHELVPRELHLLFHAGTATGLTDNQLIERFATRQGAVAEASFMALVERHGPMVFRTCQAVVRDDHEASDAFQATFLVLVRRAQTLWVRDSVGPWLHRVAYRIAVRAKVAKGRRIAAERRAARTAAVDLGGAGRDEFVSILQAEIDRLPNRYRIPIVLCDLQGHTYEEAARQEECPVGTLKSRLARGRALLRSRLTRRGFTPAVGLAITTVGVGTSLGAVPATLTRFIVVAATRYSTGRVTTSEVVSATVSNLTEGALKTMFRIKLMTISLTLAAAVTLTAGAAVLAQQASRPIEAQAQPGAISPRFKVEIRTWKEGEVKGKPVVVDVTEHAVYQVDTPEAVIQVRPKIRTEHRDQSQEAEAIRRRIRELQRKLDGEMNVRSDSIKGVVTEIDRARQTVTINVGSDDGLVLGQELRLFRRQREREYLGRLIILKTETDQAMGKIVDKQPGRDIEEGDEAAVAHGGE